MLIYIFLTAFFIFFTGQFFVSGRFLCKKGSYIVFNIISILSTLLLFNLFFSIKTSIIINIILYYLLDFSFFYVHEFRGTNFNFQDLLSIGTAKEVAGGYNFIIKPRFVLIGAINIILIFNLIQYSFHIFNIEFLSRETLQYKIIVLLLLAIDLIILSRFLYKRHYNYSINAGVLEGYIFNFFSSIPVFYIYENYILDDEKEDKIFEKRYIDVYDEYLEEKREYNEKVKLEAPKDAPNIICIMNESFGSLQKYIKTNEKVTPYFDSMKNVLKGSMYVNTIGGGTSNTEYDFLTYTVTGDSNMPVYPFNNLIKKDTYALPRYFKSLGYNTLAFHPYTKTNYNRDKVYKYFGFDKFISFDNMLLKKNERRFIRNYLSDDSMYQEVINRYIEGTKNKKKLFLYGVTIQNHGGYDNLDEKLIHIKNKSIKDKNQVENYLTLMRHSDEAIHVLIDFINKRKERIVLLFFGDHNASFGKGTNNEVFKVPDKYQFSNAYEVPFFIYDNKKKLSSKSIMTSPNFLAKLLVETAKLPLDYDLHMMSKISKDIIANNYGAIIERTKKAKGINFKYNMLQKLFMIRGYKR